MATKFEFAPGVRTIEAAPVALPPNVGPTLVGILGTALRGPVNEAKIVTRWSEYVATYGGFNPDALDLGTYVRDFFDNGGASARVLRVAPADAVAASDTANVLDRDGDAAFEVHAQSPGAWGNDLAVGFALKEVLATDVQTLLDADGNALPNAGDNADSLDTVRIPVADITKFAVGDVVDVFTSGGAHDTYDPMVVLGIDAATKSVIGNLPSGRSVTENFSLRSCSQHRIKTYATEDLADGALSLELDSIDGISRGSLLTFFLYSHVPTAPDLSVAQRYHGIVSRVSGRRVYFTASIQTLNNATLPASTHAALRYEVTDANYLTFTAVNPGASGNNISIVMDVDAANTLTVSVSGKTITIEADTTDTLADIVAAVEASAAASALVTVEAGGDDTDTPEDDMAATRLAGGAVLQVVSQEFGIDVYLGDEVAESHSYLSMIPTNPDFIESRLGGTPATYTPVSGSQSKLIIIDGASATTDTAANEFLDHPRALASVGLAGGDDGDAVTDDEWIGEESPLSGAQLLASYDDFKVLIAPGITSPAVQIELNKLAETSGKFITLLDPPSDATNASALVEHRSNDLGINNRFSQLMSTGAYIVDKRSGALRGAELLIPGSPGWAALIAQAQREIGPHGSPGGRTPSTWIRLAYNPSAADAKLLGQQGIVGFRVVAGRIQCYDDLTLLTIDDPRQFGNVSRMINQLIHDLESDLSGAIFQPGNEDVFPLVEAKLNRRLSEYCKIGAFSSRDPKQAYFVACNSETTTPEDRARGVYYAEVQLSPATLARNIILRLSVSAGGVSIA